MLNSGLEVKQMKPQTTYMERDEEYCDKQLQNKSMWRLVIKQHLKWFGKEE